MSKTGEDHPNLARRTALHAIAATAIVYLPAGLPLSEALPDEDPDAPILTAWNRLQALVQKIEHHPLGDVEDVLVGWTEELFALETTVAAMPVHGPSGVAVKVRLLKRLLDDYSILTDWTGDALKTALAALPDVGGRL